jgi:hypothetical protein
MLKLPVKKLILLYQYNEYRLHLFRDIEASLISHSFALYLLNNPTNIGFTRCKILKQASYLTRLHYIRK